MEITGRSQGEHRESAGRIELKRRTSVNSSSRGRVMAPVSYEAHAVGTRCSGIAAGGGEGEAGGGEGGGGGEGDPGGGGGGGEGEGGDGGDGGGEGEGDTTTPL